MRRVGLTLTSLLLIAISSAVSHAEESRPASLARYFPAKDLVTYVEFDGLDAHSEAWKKTAAWKILNETPTGAMLESVVRQFLEQGLAAVDEEDEDELEDAMPSVDDVSAIVRQFVRSGFAFGINRKIDDPNAKPSCIGLVLRGAGKGPLGRTIDKIVAKAGKDDESISKLTAAGGRKLTVLKADDETSFAWWTEGDDLAISLMNVKYSEAMIAALDGKQPNAVENPFRKELLAKDGGFEPVGLAFFDARALPEMPPEAAMFGLDGIKRIDVRWGYRGEALESVTRVVAPSPRKGVLALFDQPTFDSKTLPPLPSGVGSFVGTSIDLVKVFDEVLDIANQVSDGEASLMVKMGVEAFRAKIGRRLREDILSRIGPKVLLADVPTRVLVDSNIFDGFARSLARVPRLSVLFEIKDRARLIEDLDALANWANAKFPIPKDPKAKGDKPAPKLVRKLKNVEGGYEIAISPTYWPLPAGYRPSIVIGEKYASLGTTPDVARQALRSDSELDAPMTRALASLPSDLTLVSVKDTRNSALPEILANIPSLIQWWAFALQSGSGSFPIQVSRTSQVINPPAGLRPPGLPPEAAIASSTPLFDPPAPLAPPTGQPAGVPAPVAPAPPAGQPVGVPAAVEPAPIAGQAIGRTAAVAPTPSQQPAVAPAAVAPAPDKLPPVEHVPYGAVSYLPLSPSPAAVASAPNQQPVPVPAGAPGASPPSPVRPTVPEEDPEKEVTGLNLPALAMRLRLDPDEIPTPEEIRPLLFPATYSLSSDAQGFRFTSREAFPSWNPTGLAPLAIAVALPIAQSVKISTNTDEALGNLRKVGKAMKQYQEKNGHYPGPAILDKEGKPLLSWRVGLLPFLGEKDLYDEFHLDEAWDSPHNKELLERMPDVFQNPSAATDPGMTFYRGVFGKGAFFDPEVKQGIEPKDITDGGAATLAVVETREAVPWTKPGTEIPFDGDGMKSMLGGHKPGGFAALYAFGPVKFIKDSITPLVLRALSTRAEGEVVTDDDY
jgi:Protein of unknown function (DUF1559)